SYIKMRGYKIQAFAGNDQRTSKNEAYSKQALINQAFPELETVIIFDSPFWRLRVGNFKTREEAEKVLDEMRMAFPSFGKEMYIVPDEVKIPIEQSADY
ncbi:MAG: SPOR domain-containing protein, partial [Dysgonamonadaceae bacterium]